MKSDADAPPDQDMRDRITSSVGETLFVDAGAGSGKTTQLVARVVELVRRGVPIDRIAAITFTEAAAAELRDRIRRKLQEAAVAAETADPHGAGDEAAMLRAAAANADAASIQTLHAFAQSILRSHPIEAGLPPSLAVADEISSVLAFGRRFEQFRDRLFSDPAWRDLLRRFLLLKMKEDQLQVLARIFNDNWDRLPAAWAGLHAPPALPPLDVSGLVEPMREAVSYRGRCTKEPDKLATHLDDTVGPLLALVERSHGDRVLGLLASAPKISTNVGQQANWSGAKPQIIDLLKRAEGQRQCLLIDSEAAVSAELTRAMAAFVIDEAEARRREGKLEFHDLLVRARNLLRDEPAVRERLAETHQRILVDEFQDTDPLQLDIVSLICGSVDGAFSDWTGLDVPNGRVFFVGDPKQSIYRFRRADVVLYGAVRDHYQAGLCELTSNFRTVPGIIDWVNHTFDRLIASDGEGQPDYLALRAIRPPLGDGLAPITVIGGPSTLTARELRAGAAADLAAVVRQMVEDGRQVHDDGVDRPMNYGDVVVLVPSRVGVPALEDAFGDADIPYRLETASLIWSSQEVREVISILKAIDDPGDEVNLVAALRSPMLGCSDDDLAAWRVGGGRWTYLSGVDGDDLGPVAGALRTLRSLHDERWWLGPDGLIDRLATDFGAFQFALLAGRRRDRWRRLRFLADQARGFVETQRSDLAGFLAWAGLQSSDVVRVGSPTLPEADQHAVRVMTIHASKGLEFPVVALFGLDVAARQRGGVSVLWSPTGPEVKFGTRARTDGYEDLEPADEQMGHHERMRLLYVGATRARDRLILCTSYKARASAFREGTEPFGYLIEQHLPPDRHDLWVHWSNADGERPDALTESPPQVAADASEVATVATERTEFVERRAALLAAGRRAVWSATAVAKAASADAIDTEGEAAAEAADAERPWRRGRAGTAIGRAVHGALQLLDFGDLTQLPALAASQASIEGVDDAVDTVVKLATAGATAPIIRDLTSRRHWREMYVSVPVGEALVEGYVDLLAEDDDGNLVVLDYKTDSVPDATAVADRTDRYRLQAATYALAIEAVAGRTVSRALFLFLGAAGAIESEVADLDAAKSDALAILESAP